MPVPSSVTVQTCGNMAMIKQYPHFLFVCDAPEAVQDGNGNWVSSDDTGLKFVSKCREETGGVGAEYQVAGGTFRKASALIQLPKGVANIPDGAKVVVSNDVDGNDVRIQGTVLHFDFGQLHSRLWL